MIALAKIDDVGHAIGLEIFAAIERRREVAGGVVGRAIFFADQEGLGFEARMFGVEDDERALALGGEAAGGELLVDAGYLVVIKTLPEGVIKFDTQLVVDLKPTA